mgnify:CR=1 FL=1
MNAAEQSSVRWDALPVDVVGIDPDGAALPLPVPVVIEPARRLHLVVRVGECAAAIESIETALTAARPTG